jgi:hypothetical protein
MKSFNQFIQDIESIQEVKGDFGATDKYVKPKENCYGRTVKYVMAPKKKVCSLNTDSGSGGASGDSGGT